ncbi:hypothetical protein OR1_03604 [Geobacter sp. OR-1]|uniref:hypothetical protein n=1 Tax=Geobacter sp. OR-1 TaxID=1266765 RepID=UPI000542D8B7|nr:hypothetical protein [Geobacter sp. OR-1]GAM11293.1 hypothetical protein OR1_03604 [Geobacter sp. OR-1]
MKGVNSPRYRLAGTLAMINALLTIPWFIMTFLLTEKGGVWPKVAEILMQTSSTFIFVFISLALKKLLNNVHDFHATDRYIMWLIKANIVLTAISVVGVVLPSFASSVGVLTLIFVIPMGILQLIFGLKLLQLPGDLGGLHRPYCYLNIITGFSLAAIILLPLGIFSGAVADIMLGTIFFQMASHGTLIDTEA